MISSAECYQFNPVQFNAINYFGAASWGTCFLMGFFYVFTNSSLGSSPQKFLYCDTKTRDKNEFEHVWSVTFFTLMNTECPQEVRNSTVKTIWTQRAQMALEVQFSNQFCLLPMIHFSIFSNFIRASSRSLVKNWSLSVQTFRHFKPTVFEWSQLTKSQQKVSIFGNFQMHNRY